MKPALVAVLVVVAAVAGYLAGRAGESGGGRGAAGRATLENAPRATVSIPPEEFEGLRTRAERAAEVAEENARLRAELEALRPEATKPEELPAGARRPDGSIVGGGRWSKQFVQAATGFLELMLNQFLGEANLTPEQEARLREETRLRIGDALQLGADFTNGDLTGDEVYERMLDVYGDAARAITNLLDERQMLVYAKYENRVKTQLRQQIVSSEMASLRSELGLDSEQEKRVQEIVEERWQRVQANTPTAIPNILFKAVRRDADAPIYAETANQIREWLRPEQKAVFDKLEKAAPEAPSIYRNMLLPKAP